MTHSDIVLQLEENMFAYMTYLPDRCEGMEVVRDPHYFLINGGVPSTTFNFICHTRLQDESALVEQPASVPGSTLTRGQIQEQIAAAANYFGEQDLPVGWWTGPSCEPENIGEQLHHAGFTHGGLYPGMWVELERYASPPPPQTGRVQVSQVTDLEAIIHFGQIAGEVFDGTPDAARKYYEAAAEVLLEPECPFRLYLAYLDGDPVATGALFASNGVAGIYSVATLQKARKRGIGRLLTSQALHDGYRLGLQYGTLQASAQGVSMYEALGFQQCCDFDLWLPPGVNHE